MHVYVHGNCQASAIGWMLREAHPDWDIVSHEVHAVDIASPDMGEPYRAQVRRADLILAQPISDGYRGVEHLSLSWLKANKRADAVLKIFPSIYFRGYNPSSFDLHMDGHIMDYHDVHVADMFLAGVSPGECHDRIAAPGFFTQGFAQSEFFRNLRSLARREREAKADALASPIILREYDRELMFHTFNHPSRRILCGVIDQLLQAAGLSTRVAAMGRSYLDNVRIMPYRSLAAHLDIPDEAIPERGLMIRPGVVESLRDYVEAAYGCYRAAGEAAVRERIAAHPEAGAYLRRFHHDGAGAGLDLHGLALSLFQELLGRDPSDWEVRYWVKVMDEAGPEDGVRRFTGSAEFRDRLRGGA